MATHLKAVASSMGLPTRVSTDDIRQLIEGKLSEEGHEPHNVQVVIQEPTQEESEGDGTQVCVCMCLVDDGRAMAGQSWM